MKKRTIPLQHKILFGYIILMAVIGSMAAILIHERTCVRDIETETLSIRQVRCDISSIQRDLTILSSLGESVIAWEEEDFYAYRARRHKVDSLLQVLQRDHGDVVGQSQTDSLRKLLADKETHLYRIMELFHRQDQADSLLVHHLPEAARQATMPRTVTRKKKGIAGMFGGKKTVELPPSPERLHELNGQLIVLQTERIRSLDNYTDSLRSHNRRMNRKLHILLDNIDGHVQEVFREREEHISKSHERSVTTITVLVISAIILLLVSYLVIHRDLREKARTRKRLEETVGQNTALLEMHKNIILAISHDIRAPLNIISGNAELAMETREKKQRNTYLNNVGTVCRHVVHQLNNLLDVYRLNEAKEVCNDVPFDLHGLLERTASGFSRVVNNKGILFDCDFKDTEVRLLGDADRIEQIIDNLLTNAVKFTEFGTISFHVRYCDGELVMEVKDTGIGMSKETLSRIFRPFERRTSATNADGYGLGLPITQGLVNLLGGTILVSSDIDWGSTFRVTLPLPETNEQVEDENRIVPHPTHLPRNVLVIDDDSMLCDVVKEMLERNSITCTVCSTVKDVVRAMRGRDYDLLLSDIQMPGTNGFELLALLLGSAIGNSRTIPVVAMTARGDREKEAFLNAVFTACIYKPFSSFELLSLLSTMGKYPPGGNRGIDFSTMLSEVNDKVKLLRSFLGQSKQDMEDLESAMKNCDRNSLRETVHRMLPMWELLQMEDALYAYRALLKDDTATDDIVREHTRQIMECTAKLITEAENEIERQTNEKENTDS